MAATTLTATTHFIKRTLSVGGDQPLKQAGAAIRRYLSQGPSSSASKFSKEAIAVMGAGTSPNVPHSGLGLTDFQNAITLKQMEASECKELLAAVKEHGASSPEVAALRLDIQGKRTVTWRAIDAARSFLGLNKDDQDYVMAEAARVVGGTT